MKWTIIGLLLGLPFGLFAQIGDLYLHNYQAQIANVNNQNYALVQGQRGIMYFANNSGILSYDGLRWDMINTPNTPYALASDPVRNPYIYVGSKGNFGYLQIDDHGRSTYQMLHQESNMGVITQILIGKSHIYFYSPKALFKVSLKNHRLVKSWYAQENAYAGFFMRGQDIYLNIQNKGLHKAVQNDWLALEVGSRFANNEILAAVPYGQSQLILGTDKGAFFTFDGDRLSPYTFEAQKYVADKLLAEGLELSDNQFVLSTLSGGCVVIAKETGKTLSTINYFTGLPDDEVLAMNRDMHGSLWICHEYGITRLDTELPIRDHSNYLGIEGNITAFIEMDSVLYTATNEGVFYLSEATDYGEVQSLIQKMQSIQQIQNYNKKVREYQARVNQNRKKKGIGGVLENIKSKVEGKKYNSKKAARQARRERKKQEREQKRNGTQIQEFQAPDLTQETFDIDLNDFSSIYSEEVYATTSQPFVYRPVEGITGKCRQFVPYQNRLLVASNIGLYEIINQKARLLIPNIYVNFIYPSVQIPNRIYIVTAQGLESILYEKGQWIIERKFKALSSEIFSLVEDGNTLWLGSESQVIKVALDDYGNYLNSKIYPFQEGYSRNIVVRTLDQKPAFFLYDGIYRYNPEKDNFIKDQKLSTFYNVRSRVVFNQAGYTWVQAQNKWVNLNHPQQLAASQLVFLQIFKNIQDIFVDTQGNLWVVNNNRLYHLSNQARLEDQEDFNIFIKSILDKQSQYLPLEGLRLDQQDKNLSFKFYLASPFYLNESDTEFSYWLEGLDQTWSKWDKQAILAFPFLPSGKYKLHVRAKNVFGQLSEEQVFDFRISPPFWETWWFYVLQTVVLIGLLVASFYLNRSGKNALVSYILVFVTVVTIFEFLILLMEPYVELYSGGVPVFKLGMNIMLALSLAPIEKAINRWAGRKRSKTSQAQS